MQSIIDTIMSSIDFLFTGVETIKNCIGIVFNLFPSDIRTLLIWVVGFLFIASVVKFVKS